MENKKTKVFAIIGVLFIIIIITVLSVKPSERETLSDTGLKYVAEEKPLGYLVEYSTVTPEPAEPTFAPTDKPSNYVADNYLSTEYSIVETVESIFNISKDVPKLKELAITENLYNKVTRGIYTEKLENRYIYGVNDTDFFIVYKDYLIKGTLVNNQIDTIDVERIK